MAGSGDLIHLCIGLEGSGDLIHLCMAYGADSHDLFMGVCGDLEWSEQA